MQGEKKQTLPEKKLSIYQSTESCISLELASNTTIPSAIIKAFKKWDIRTLYLSNDILNKSELQKSFKAGAFKDFSIFFNFDPDIRSYLADHPDQAQQILRQRIFSGNSYVRRQKNWGCNQFHFYDDQPEIIPIKRRTKDLRINDPESVFRLFFSASLSGEQDIQFIDVTESYDSSKQRIEAQSHDGFIIVLRKYGLSANDHLNRRLNYFETAHLKRVLKIFSTRVQNRLGDLQNLQFDFDTLFSGVYRNQHFDYHPELLTSCPDLIEEMMRFWLNPQPYFAAYGYAFNQYFQSVLKPLLDRSASQVVYLIAVSNPLINNLALDHSFLLSVDQNLFRSDTPYYEQTITHLKRAESRRQSQDISGMPVAIHHLLNLDFSFSEKLEQFSHLLAYGANQFHFRFDVPNELASKLHLIDPSYKAYDGWFKRLNFAGRLLSEGIPLTELLILYPGLDSDLSMFNQAIKQVRLSGLDYTLLDFDLFNDEQICTIKDDKVQFSEQAFKIILLPAIRIIGLETLKKISAFIEAGGIVIAIGRVPESGLPNDSELKFIKLNQEIWFEGSRNHSTSFRESASGGASYFQADISLLPNLLNDFQNQLNVHIESDHPGVRYRLRKTEEHFTLFVANLNENQQVTCDISANLYGRPFYWDFSKHKARPLSQWYRDEKERIHFHLSLPPNQAEFILINKRSSAESWQVLESDLDYLQFEKDNVLTGFRRRSGNSIIRLKKANEFIKVPVRVPGKLPVLTISKKNWFLESDNFSGAVDLGDYARLFPFRSGTITYHKLIIIEDLYLNDQRLLLSLGNLKDWCSLRVNDQFVGDKFEEPWEYDISRFIKKGENRLSISITNTISNLLASDNDDFNVRDYGLYGPVKIIPSSRFVIDLTPDQKQIT